jgi:Uma2 family endonuclease
VLTAEDLYELPDDGYRYELLRGMLVSEPRPSFEHGRCVARFTTILSTFVESHRLGIVVAGDPGFILARRPDTLRGPDVAFVTAERASKIDPAAAWFSGAPDLAVEVLSPHDRVNDVLAKVSDYLAAGCRMVWIADPILAEVSVGLGGMQDPSTGQAIPPSLPLAKHYIDLLEVVQKKTQGNLDENEQRVIDGTLHELRAAFVQVVNELRTAAAPPAGHA